MSHNTTLTNAACVRYFNVTDGSNLTVDKISTFMRNVYNVLPEGSLQKDASGLILIDNSKSIMLNNLDAFLKYISLTYTVDGCRLNLDTVNGLMDDTINLSVKRRTNTNGTNRGTITSIRDGIVEAIMDI
jgi:hypothetical protein